jgi:flavorubredoxin
LKYMEGFHRRYMTGNRAMRLWADMVRKLDIEIIAPQHGALFRGKPMVQKFIDWCASLECGVDLMTQLYKAPTVAPAE